MESIRVFLWLICHHTLNWDCSRDEGMVLFFLGGGGGIVCKDSSSVNYMGSSHYESTRVDNFCEDSF